MPPEPGHDEVMVIVHGTKRFRDRVPGREPSPDEHSDGVLGSWYANLLRWRPYVALFVNDRTLLPVLIPMAPAATLLDRFPSAVGQVLRAHQMPEQLIEAEMELMDTVRLTATADRRLTGMLTEFAFLATAHRHDAPDLDALSARLAKTPCGPLYQGHVSPDRELAALIDSLRPEG